MGSVGLTEPINFEKRVLEPINFWRSYPIIMYFYIVQMPSSLVLTEIFSFNFNFFTIVSRSFNPNQSGRFGWSIEPGDGMCPQEFSSYFVLVFHQKSTKHGLKWKLASLSTSRAFEHLPKLHSFVVRRRLSSLLWPRKFSSFRYHNFWKLVIFDLHGQYVYQMKAENILNANLT